MDKTVLGDSSMRLSHICTFGLAMVVFAISLWHAAGQTGKGRTFAFLVACGDYDPSELKPVPFTLHEMKLFRDVLIASGTPADNIVYLHDKTDKPGRFIPNRANILKEYKLLLERLRPEDSLVVAISGHGIQYRTDASGYFCPLDAKLGPAHKKTLIALEGEEGLLTMLEKTKAQRKLVLVNACRNEPATNTFLAAEKLELRDDYNEEPPKGTVVLFACGKGQKSYFYPDTEKREDRRNRSLFMYHVTEAWKGSYAKGKKVTLDHVLSEVRDRVEDEAPRDFRNNQLPLARKKGFEGSWVVAARTQESPSPKSATTQALAILSKSVEAYGGESAILKYQAHVVTKKDNLYGQVTETSRQRPNKVKWIVTRKGEEKKFTGFFDGNRLWYFRNGMTEEEKDDKKVKSRRNAYVLGLLYFPTTQSWALWAILNEDHGISSIAEEKVDKSDTVGIRIGKGDDYRNLYFDKKTHLLVRMTWAWDYVEEKRHVIVENEFSDFRRQDGLATPWRVKSWHDGKLLGDEQITELRYLEKLDDSHFRP